MAGLLWRPAYVAIGSNLNDPRRQVLQAFEALSSIPQTQLLARSRLYLTAPMGPQDQPHFVNAAAGLLTRCSAHELLAHLLAVERSMGRDRRERWGPRVIDLDLAWMWGVNIADAQLIVPHPGVSSRNFVLYPLADIAPTIKIAGAANVGELALSVGGVGISVLES